MSNPSTSKIRVGTWVKVSGFDPGEEEVFYIVPESQADVIENKIPPSNPLARVLEGAKPGDTIAFSPPVGEVELVVLDVGRS